MVTRIVKLHFKDAHTAQFLSYFERIKHQVNGFEGCIAMKLFQDRHNPNIVMTYSQWESEEALEKYRHSETFGEIWPRIKPWFAVRAEAWTVNTCFDGFAHKKKSE